MYHISISEKDYKEKPSDYKSMTFVRTPFDSFIPFIEQIRQGHSFCHNMNDKDEPFGCAQKTAKNFSYTHIVVFDFDKTEVSPKQFYTTASRTPSFLYTSYSHSPNTYKYHALYFFKEKIKSQEEYAATYDRILLSIQNTFPEITADSSLRNVSQLTNGSFCLGQYYEEYKEKEVVVYSINDFQKHDCGGNKEDVREGCSFTDNKNERKKNILFINEQFRQDLFSMSIHGFIAKYSAIYEYRDASRLKYENGYALTGDNYIKIQRPWHNLGNGKKSPITYKGSRHRTLFLRGLLFKQIFPNITHEHLVYCLMYELRHYIDNSEPQISPKDIINIATSCINTDYTLEGKNIPKFRIDREWCNQNGVNPRSFQQHIRKILKDAEIGELYDASLSIRKNKEIMEKAGLKVSVGRLSKFVKENVK